MRRVEDGLQKQLDAVEEIAFHATRYAIMNGTVIGEQGEREMRLAADAFTVAAALRQRLYGHP